MENVPIANKEKLKKYLSIREIIFEGKKFYYVLLERACFYNLEIPGIRKVETIEMDNSVLCNNLEIDIATVNRDIEMAQQLSALPPHPGPAATSSTTRSNPSSNNSSNAQENSPPPSLGLNNTSSSSRNASSSTRDSVPYVDVALVNKVQVEGKLNALVESIIKAVNTHADEVTEAPMQRNISTSWFAKLRNRSSSKNSSIKAATVSTHSVVILRDKIKVEISNTSHNHTLLQKARILADILDRALAFIFFLI